MQTLTRDDLMPLERYAEQRAGFRAKAMAHKRNRRVLIGPHAALYFEDRLTIQYQVQEMLRVERIFESTGIEEELAAYNPLIPDGNNLKATFMLEYEDEDERRVALAGLKGVEDRVWIQAGDMEPVFSVADEDMERENEEKTSSVHFVRFELTAGMIAELKGGAELGAGIDHDNYTYAVERLPANVRDSLVGDLD